MDINAESISRAKSLLRFIDKSPTPFHAVAEMSEVLGFSGFSSIHEQNVWNLRPGGRYIVTRNGSTIAAFIIGQDLPQNSGISIIGAHTDSPNLRLKQNPVYDNYGYMQFGVEPYGGLLLASWLNRDLSIAGRIVLSSKLDGEFESHSTRLLKIDRPILSIPQLAIHLNRQVNESGLIINQQKHLPPLTALVDPTIDSQARFNDLIREAGNVSNDETIVGMDLALYDTQPGMLAGINFEFILASRLDNLASCHAAICALSEVVGTPDRTLMVVCYDHEEVGSLSATGANSSLLKSLIERIICSPSIQTQKTQSSDNFGRTIAHSFCISADMAHAVHPNYADKHDPMHMPVIGNGPVIKTNPNQRYASDAFSSAIFASLCDRANVPHQQFMTRSDLACGTTIGPITAAQLGIQTVDVGNPMLSMHAIREQAGVADHHSMIKVFKEFFAPEPS